MTTVQTSCPSDKPTLAQEVAFALADLYRVADSHMRAPNPLLHVTAQGDQVKLGVCIAAEAIRTALSKHAEGLVALGDLVHKPRLNDGKGE